MKVQELCFGTGFYKGRMPVVVLEKRNATVMLQQFIKKIGFEFKDGAFVGDGMGMGHRAFIAGFGYQHATIVRIERPAKYIEQEISLANKTDAECRAVFGFGRTAIGTPAFEI